jgi:hypothetical protein
MPPIPMPPVPAAPPDSIAERSTAAMIWHPDDATSEVMIKANDVAEKWFDLIKFRRFITQLIPRDT